jgi:hypothetical protein
MKAIAIFLLFIGTILIVQGYYSKKDNKCEKEKVIIKYIPRSVYEDQMKPEESLETYYKGMFENIILK